MNWLLSKVLIACLQQCTEQISPAMAYSVLSNVLSKCFQQRFILVYRLFVF